MAPTICLLSIVVIVYLAEVCVPDYWEPQPRDASGRELTVHLVPLNPNDPKYKDEYKLVSDQFYQTANEQIVAIHRVQNPSLFKLYSLKKQSLDEKNGSNEKFLFHGTKGDKLNEINEHGLNRSYAGNTHGTVKKLFLECFSTFIAINGIRIEITILLLRSINFYEKCRH